ncbi:MAG: hypothetical protein WCJ30_08150 [Deltaproteobacteria bacterium]
MVDRPARPDAPWWEAVLPSTQRELRDFLERRLPALRAQHDDLLNDALMHLSERVRAREGLPDGWFGDGRDVDEAARLYFVRLAMTILRRRVADGFRGTAKRWAERADDATLEHAAGDAPDATRVVTIARMLRVCIDALEGASDHDRALLAGVAGLADAPRREGDAGADTEQPLDARDRQRLKRLRTRLAAEIRARLGDDVASLLREDD